MIENPKIAKELSDLMLNISSELNSSLVHVKSACSEDEFYHYRECVAKILGELLVEGLNPIFIKHPELKPKDFYLPEK